MQGFKTTSGGPPEDPVLQALSAGMHRNDSMRLFSKLVKLGQGIHLPHLLVNEMRAMAQDAGVAGGARVPCWLSVVFRQRELCSRYDTPHLIEHFLDEVMATLSTMMPRAAKGLFIHSTTMGCTPA